VIFAAVARPAVDAGSPAGAPAAARLGRDLAATWLSQWAQGLVGPGFELVGPA